MLGGVAELPGKVTLGGSGAVGGEPGLVAMDLDFGSLFEALSASEGGIGDLGAALGLFGEEPISFVIDGSTLYLRSPLFARLFDRLSVAEEVALFLLINEKQKRVRTDLGVRVVQRYLDDGELTDTETRILNTVVPESDQWRYEASRVAGRLNRDSDSP